jgi:hypothetical protein
MLPAKRSGTLLPAVATALAPTLLILIAITVAMVSPEDPTLIILGGVAVAAAASYLLRRYRTSRGVPAGPADRQRRPDAPDKTMERVR